jgi:selenocysteine lyase/cysteine desulfurase
MEEGDNVVSNDMEFPSNAYPWLSLDKRGVACRQAKNRSGRVTLAEIAPMVDAPPASSRFRGSPSTTALSPPAEISRFCRERHPLRRRRDQARGVADGRAAAGADVAADSQGLLGPEGCAIFFVAESARDRVPPLFAGWWNILHAKGYLEYDLDFYKSARRYEPGTLATANIAGLAAALDLLTEVGAEAVRARILKVCEALKGGLAERGWRIATPEPLRSGILSAAPPDADPRAVSKQPESAASSPPRGKAPSASPPHFYNDQG